MITYVGPFNTCFIKVPKVEKIDICGHLDASNSVQTYILKNIITRYFCFVHILRFIYNDYNFIHLLHYAFRDLLLCM
jgi:hypothetical protein